MKVGLLKAVNNDYHNYTLIVYYWHFS